MSPARTRNPLQAIDFATLFIEELGGSHPQARKAVPSHDTAEARKPHIFCSLGLVKAQN